MKPSRVKSILSSLIKTSWAVFVWGPPGAGKSSLVREVADEAKLPVIDVRATLLDPTDIRGIPAVQNGQAVWHPPSFLPTEGQQPGILFLDELNTAPPLVQASLYQLTLDRQIGEYQLPAGWFIIAAGNRAQDASIVHRMPAALANRFVHLDFEVDANDWRSWAIGAKIDPRILGFIATRPAILHDMSRPERGFPTPRSWHMLSDVLATVGDVEDAVDVAIGVVGEGAAMEFLGYCRDAISLKRIQEILADPTNAQLPEKLGDLYALLSWMATNGADGGVRAAAATLLGRLAPEFGVLLARDMMRASPRFMTEKGYLAFAAKHKEFLK
jgi:hypothetical protein